MSKNRGVVQPEVIELAQDIAETLDRDVIQDMRRSQVNHQTGAQFRGGLNRWNKQLRNILARMRPYRMPADGLIETTQQITKLQTQTDQELQSVLRNKKQAAAVFSKLQQPILETLVDIEPYAEPKHVVQREQAVLPANINKKKPVTPKPTVNTRPPRYRTPNRFDPSSRNPQEPPALPPSPFGDKEEADAARYHKYKCEMIASVLKKEADHLLEEMNDTFNERNVGPIKDLKDDVEMAIVLLGKLDFKKRDSIIKNGKQYYRIDAVDEQKEILKEILKYGSILSDHVYNRTDLFVYITTTTYHDLQVAFDNVLGIAEHALRLPSIVVEQSTSYLDVHTVLQQDLDNLIGVCEDFLSATDYIAEGMAQDAGILEAAAETFSDEARKGDGDPDIMRLFLEHMPDIPLGRGISYGTVAGAISDFLDSYYSEYT